MIHSLISLKPVITEHCEMQGIKPLVINYKVYESKQYI